MRPPLLPTATLLLLLVAPRPTEGQARAQSVRDADSIPREMRPPAGKCRIWMQGVPAAQQPAATDCSTALRQKPVNGLVVYGPAAPRRGMVGFEATPADRARDRLAASRARTSAAGGAKKPDSSTVAGGARGANGSAGGAANSSMRGQEAGTATTRRDSTQAAQKATPPKTPPKAATPKKKPERS